MFVEGVVTDVQGKPIPNAIIDTWETDGHGQYDTQVSRLSIFFLKNCGISY
jgi:protocatechuate 3,4-dioxygenase beta subunit